MLTVNLHQDSLGWWYATVQDGQGNTLASLSVHKDKASAEKEAERWIEKRERRGQDVEGGGYR